MNITVRFKNITISGKVTLPASKSISNRVLVIHELADSLMPVENLSDCDDTRSMLSALHSDAQCFDVGHAGTAMRFLTAFLSRIAGRWEITGSERMKERPISVLVEALNALGARIEYLEEPGFPPLRIYGSHLSGGELQIAASVSSQYISALMMIAPYMSCGLKLVLTGKRVSYTYIKMTEAIMRQFGAKVRIEGNVIDIEACPYTPVPYRIESDWSAASYFYELLAVAGGGEITLSGLTRNSLQGDAAQQTVWKRLGVDTFFEGDGVCLVSGKSEITHLKYDFVEMPDLVQSFVVACCMKGVSFEFTGVETLRVKETDRIKALMDESAKLGYLLQAEGDHKLMWDGSRCPETGRCIETYRDHRMAMAFAPAAFQYPDLEMVDRDVVSKSFPAYWEQMKVLGLEIF